MQNTTEAVPINKAAVLFPGRPHISTLHRWRLHGVRGVKLRTLLVGGRRYVRPDDAAEFIAALSGESSLRDAALGTPAA